MVAHHLYEINIYSTPNELKLIHTYLQRKWVISISKIFSFWFIKNMTSRGEATI